MGIAGFSGSAGASGSGSASAGASAAASAGSTVSAGASVSGSASARRRARPAPQRLPRPRRLRRSRPGPRRPRAPRRRSPSPRRRPRHPPRRSRGRRAHGVGRGGGLGVVRCGLVGGIGIGRRGIGRRVLFCTDRGGRSRGSDLLLRQPYRAYSWRATPRVARRNLVRRRTGGAANSLGLQQACGSCCEGRSSPKSFGDRLRPRAAAHRSSIIARSADSLTGREGPASARNAIHDEKRRETPFPPARSRFSAGGHAARASRRRGIAQPPRHRTVKESRA